MKSNLETRALALSLLKQQKRMREISRSTGLSVDVIRLWKNKFQRGDLSWVKAGKDKKKLSPKEKEEALQLHFQEGKSSIEVANLFGVSRSVIRCLLRKYKNEDKKKEKSLTERDLLRRAVIVKYRSGEIKSGIQLAKFFGLHPRQVQRWIRQERVRKDCYDESISSEDMDKVMRLSLSSQLSQKTAIKNWVVREFDLKDRSRSNLVRLVKEINEQGVPINEACQWLHICRSSYYRWKKKNPDGTEDLIVGQIRNFQEKHYYAYGSKRMAVYLSRLNKQAINHKRVARLMKLHGLNSRVRPKRCFKAYESTGKCLAPLRNLLKRDFQSDVPYTKMVTDMTFIPVREGWLVLSAIKDLFSHKIVGAAFGAAATIDLALETLKGLPNSIGAIGKTAVIHSDQGSCYTSEKYREAAGERGFCCSFSRKGNCLDNASIESFFGHLKSETYYRLSPVERSRLKRVDAQRMVESYIKWYNEERVQKSLGYQSPSEVILSYEALRLS